MCNGVIEGAVAIIATVVEAASEASAVIGVGALATEGASLIAECAGDPALANVFGSLSKIFGAVAGVAGGAGAIVSGLGEAAATVGADSVATSLGTDLSTAASNPDLESLLAAHHLISGFGSLGLMLSGNSKAAEYFGLVSGAAGGALGLAQGGTALSQAAAATTFGSSMGGLALESSGNKEAAAALGVVGGLGASGMTFADWGGAVPPNFGRIIEPPDSQVGGGGGRYYFDQEPEMDAGGPGAQGDGSGGTISGEAPIRLAANDAPTASANDDIGLTEEQAQIQNRDQDTRQLSDVGGGGRVYTGPLPEGSVLVGVDVNAGFSYYRVPGMSSLLVVPMLQVNNTPLPTGGSAVQEIFNRPPAAAQTPPAPGGAQPGTAAGGDIYQQADAEHEAEIEEVYGTKKPPAGSASYVGTGLVSRSPSISAEAPAPIDLGGSAESSESEAGVPDALAGASQPAATIGTDSPVTIARDPTRMGTSDPFGVSPPPTRPEVDYSQPSLFEQLQAGRPSGFRKTLAFPAIEPGIRTDVGMLVNPDLYGLGPEPPLRGMFGGGMIVGTGGPSPRAQAAARLGVLGMGVVAGGVSAGVSALGGLLEGGLEGAAEAGLGAETASTAEAGFGADAAAADAGLGVEPGANAGTGSDEYVNLASPERTQHILYGDGPGSGGHLWPGQPGKTPFPEGWSPEEVMHNVSDVATDPASIWVQKTGPEGSLYTRAGDPARFLVFGQRNGVWIKVVVDPAGEGIVTAYPVKGPP